MCFDEWNMNKQLLVSMFFTNLNISPTREGAVHDINRDSEKTHAVLTQDSDAWRKLKTCPQC